MPKNITISRAGAALPRLTRGAVKPGQVFVKVLDGRPSTKPYAAIGRNCKMFSVNVTNGELASSTRDDAPVALVGSFEYHIERDPAATRRVKRKDVQNGETFVVKGGNKHYGHLGRLTDGKFMSVNFATDDYATTQNGDSEVLVVGKFAISAKLAA